MAPILQLHRKEVHHQAWLFSVVFASKLSLLTALVLFASLLIQPVHKVFALEPVPEETLPLPVAPAEEVADEEVVKVEEDISETIEETVLEQTSDEVTLPEDLEPPIEENLEDFSEVASPSTEPMDTATDDSVILDDENIFYEEPLPDLPEETEDDDAAEKVQSVVTEDNFYQFSKQSCVAVGDGTFHCTKVSEAGAGVNSVVYAELGKNKNMEIFLRTARGELKQITDNYFDDTAPFYDADSMRIVWQRLIDGRYQIMMYDIKEKRETQLTFSRTNNMEPKVSKEGIVWQAWDGNDWEVMYFDGVFTDQITNNETQDVTPVIDDGYILWSVLGSEAQEAKVYTLSNKQITTITGYEGGTIANPRFVLVYDTKFENGDVITQGFDPLTGLSAPISAQPAQEPVDIPESDPVGEIRALIQNKTHNEDEFDIDNNDPAPGTGDNPFDSGSTTAKAAAGTLILDQANSGSTTEITKNVILTPAPLQDNNFELSEYDLVITKSPSGEVSVSTTSVTAAEL